MLQRPYLQLGDRPKLESPESLLALWHAVDADADWTAELQRDGSPTWRRVAVRLLRTVHVPGAPPHRVYAAELDRLPPGRPFRYRVGRNGVWVFESPGRARRPPGEEHTFAVMGDIAAGSAGQRAVAWHLGQAKPEYLVEVGDIVYSRGRVSEYYEKYFPILNCDQPAPDSCGAILRSTLSFALPGNHDIASRVDWTALPDSLAYFYYWSLPLNGPVPSARGRHVPEMTGDEGRREQFLAATPQYPRMAMYSVDYGDVHWTMLDSNVYVDWTDPKLRDWVRQDLRAAKRAAWRLVGVHHPPFNSSRSHFNDQWIRLLADIFQQEGVAVVFSGHVHNYQRTHPLRFVVESEAAQGPMKRGRIGGAWQLDCNYDGLTRTAPEGVIWVVTGAGGASLDNPEQEAAPETWQPFTAKFISTVQSFTLATVKPEELIIRQMDHQGREVDCFRISRPPRSRRTR